MSALSLPMPDQIIGGNGMVNMIGGALSDYRQRGAGLYLSEVL